MYKAYYKQFGLNTHHCGIIKLISNDELVICLEQVQIKTSRSTTSAQPICSLLNCNADAQSSINTLIEILKTCPILITFLKILGFDCCFIILIIKIISWLLSILRILSAESSNNKWEGVMYLSFYSVKLRKTIM